MSNENDPTGEVGPDGRYRVWFCAYPESPGGPCTPAIPHESNWGTCRWVSESAAYEPGDPAPSAPVAPEPDGRLTEALDLLANGSWELRAIRGAA